MTSAVNESRRRAEMQSEIFADRLRHFVQRWKSEDPYEVHDFQMNLTNLMVDAMRSQTATMACGVETYVSTMIQERSLQPLTIIMEQPKK